MVQINYTPKCCSLDIIHSTREKFQYQQEASGFAEVVDAAAASSSSAMEAAAKAVAQFLFEEGRLSKNQGRDSWLS